MSKGDTSVILVIYSVIYIPAYWIILRNFVSLQYASRIEAFATEKYFMVAIMALCLTAIAQKQSSKTLVAYFSATGTTEKAAKVVAEVTGGTLYEIQPAKKYTSADLDWHDKSSRSSVEMADAKSRPALSSKAANLADYDTVYIGFPIWWNLAPRIINTFIESGDFSGKTVILFATSGGSSISNSEKELQKTYSNLKWQKGKLLNGATKEDIKQWTKK